MYNMGATMQLFKKGVVTAKQDPAGFCLGGATHVKRMAGMQLLPQKVRPQIHEELHYSLRQPVRRINFMRKRN